MNAEHRTRQPAVDSGDTATRSPLDILFAMFQGGGNIPLIVPIVNQLTDRGHRVRVLAGNGVRSNRLPISPDFLSHLHATGAEVIQVADPEPHPFDITPPIQGLIRGWTPDYMKLIPLTARPNYWSPAWSQFVWSELQKASADVVAADFVLIGALAAAEAAGIPAAVIVHQAFYPWPAPGAPPYGTGAMPARGPLRWLRDRLFNAASRRIYIRDGLAPHNRARAQLGLEPLHSPLDQYDRAARVLLLGSKAFDFPARRLPPNVRYVSAPTDTDPVPRWVSPWPDDDPRPLVLVSLSTLAFGQGPIIQRILIALADLPVRALVTIGPSLDPGDFTAPPNVQLETFVPHAAVMPETAAMVTQCGLSTLMKALAAGLPLVCIPIGADQPDNAARVVARGAGISLTPDASPDQIGVAIQRVLDDPRYRAAAQRLAAVLANEDGTQNAADEIEIAARTRQM